MTVSTECREVVVGPNFVAAQPGYYLVLTGRADPQAPFDVVETPIIGWNVMSRVCPDCRRIDNDVIPVTVLPIEEQQPYYIVRQPDGHYLVEGECMFESRAKLVEWLNNSDQASDMLAEFINSLGGAAPAKKKASGKKRAKKVAS